MCGIGGVFSAGTHNFPDQEVQKLFVLLTDRGSHASGYSVKWQGADKPVIHKTPSSARTIAGSLGKLVAGQNTLYAMLHTRYSTQGNKHNNGNNHPVLGHGYIVTHNGVIHGDDDYVFDMLPHVTRLYTVDTEAINAALRYSNPSWVLDNIYGSMSVAYVDEYSPTELYLFTNGLNPLVYGRTVNGDIVYASTREHIQKAGFKMQYILDCEPFYLYQFYRKDGGVAISSTRVSADSRPAMRSSMYHDIEDYETEAGYTEIKP